MLCAKYFTSLTLWARMEEDMIAQKLAKQEVVHCAADEE